MPYGPCIICGAINYPNSYGGPNICPSCDCGKFDGPMLAANNAKLQAQLSAQGRELEEFNKKWALIKLAFSDYHEGKLHEISLITVLGGIINPPEITAEDIDWANKALVAYDKIKEEPKDAEN